MTPKTLWCTVISFIIPNVFFIFLWTCECECRTCFEIQPSDSRGNTLMCSPSAVTTDQHRFQETNRSTWIFIFHANVASRVCNSNSSIDVCGRASVRNSFLTSRSSFRRPSGCHFSSFHWPFTEVVCHFSGTSSLSTNLGIRNVE